MLRGRVGRSTKPGFIREVGAELLGAHHVVDVQLTTADGMTICDDLVRGLGTTMDLAHELGVRTTVRSIRALSLGNGRGGHG